MRSGALFRRARRRLGQHGNLRGFFRLGTILGTMTEKNMSETVASTQSTARNEGGIDADNRFQDSRTNAVAEASGTGNSGDSAPSIVRIADGDGAARVRRTMPFEEPRRDPPAVRAAINQASHGATAGMHVDESLRAPVVASQEEIVLAEQLRLELKRKYLNEPR